MSRIDEPKIYTMPSGAIYTQREGLFSPIYDDEALPPLPEHPLSPHNAPWHEPRYEPTMDYRETEVHASPWHDAEVHAARMAAEAHEAHERTSTALEFMLGTADDSGVTSADYRDTSDADAAEFYARSEATTRRLRQFVTVCLIVAGVLALSMFVAWLAAWAGNGGAIK